MRNSVPQLFPLPGCKIVARRIADAAPVLVSVAQQAALNDHPPEVIVCMTRAECIEVAAVGSRRRHRRAPGAGGNVIETGFFLSPLEATVVATAAEDEDLVVVQYGRVSCEED